MENPGIESIPILVGHEAAIDAVRTLALRVAADCLEHGEDVPEPIARVFSLA